MSKYTPFHKPDFGKPPPGYIPGLGRGAAGFVTNHDLAPGDASLQNITMVNYDSWAGYDIPLFKSAVQEKEDQEADLAYKYFDRYLGSRYKKQPEPVKQESLSDGFKDLKRELSRLTDKEWLDIPEAAQHGKKRVRWEKPVAAPDHLLVEAFIQSRPSTQEVGGSVSQYHQSKCNMITASIQKVTESVVGQTVIDKQGYLTQMQSNAEQKYIGDPAKARLLFKSAFQTNPSSAKAWIGAARIQELDGKLKQARLLMKRAIEHCPNDQDVWLQAVRLQQFDRSRETLQSALLAVPKSIKLWKLAAQRQTEKYKKARRLKSGLQHNPSSVQLWKDLIDLEPAEEARYLLQRAVECLPKQIDFWLALSRLQTYQRAKAVLNKARKHLPAQPAIWVCAAQLQQKNAKSEAEIDRRLASLLLKASKNLQALGIAVKRDQWIQLAKQSFLRSNSRTAFMIAKLFCALGLQKKEIQVLLLDAQKALQEGFPAIGQAILDKYVDEADQKNSVRVSQLIEQYLPQRMVTWLHKLSEVCKDNSLVNKVCKRYYQQRNYQKAKQIISYSAADPYLKLLKAKIVKKQEGIERAIGQLRLMFQVSKDQLLASKLAWWQHKSHSDEAYQTINSLEGQSEYYWLVKSVLLEQFRPDSVQSHYQQMVLKARIEYSSLIWRYILYLARKEQFTKARSFLQRCKAKQPRSLAVTLLSINLQLMAKHKQNVAYMLAKALKDFPNSIQLDCLSLELSDPLNRKKKATDMVARYPNCPEVAFSIAKLFYRQGKTDRASKWTQKAIELEPSNGDYWSFLALVLGNQQFSRMYKEQIGKLKLSKGQTWSYCKFSRSQKLQKLVAGGQIIEHLIPNL